MRRIGPGSQFGGGQDGR